MRFSTYSVAALRVVIDDDVLEELLEHEAQLLATFCFGSRAPAGATLVERVVAASSLLGPASVVEAADVVARVPDLGRPSVS